MSLSSLVSLCLLFGLGILFFLYRPVVVLMINHGFTTIEDIPDANASEKPACMPDADSSDDDDGSPNRVLVSLHKQVTMNEARRRLK